MRSFALVLSSLAALALAACAPSSDDKGGGSPPLGYELAVAKQAAAASTQSEVPGLIEITPEQLRTKLDAGNIRLIDVRTDEEVAEGMIPGAEHIALDDFDPASLDLSDGREVVLYCRSDRRSGIAGEKLAAFTGKPVEHLDGGIIAWEAAFKAD